MTNRQTYNFNNFSREIFRMIFEPIYGYAVDFDADYSHYCVNSIKYIILTNDSKNDYYHDNDWIVRISVISTNPISVNTNHPYYEDIKDKVHDFVEEVGQYV